MNAKSETASLLFIFLDEEYLVAKAIMILHLLDEIFHVRVRVRVRVRVWVRVRRRACEWEQG